MAAHRESSSLVRTLVRIVVALGGAALLFTGVVGLLHLPGAKPLLLTLLGRCPIGFDVAITEDARDAARATTAATVRGDAPALSRPALGFALDTAARADVLAWAELHGVTCAPEKANLKCVDAPATALGGRARDHITFVFDGRDRLTAVDAVAFVTVDEAAALQQAVTAELAAATGPAHKSIGQPDASYLSAATLRTASTEFRFADYRAQVIALNLGKDRFSLRESYQSLVTPATPVAAAE